MPLIKSCEVCQKPVKIASYRAQTFRACSHSCRAKLGAVGTVDLVCGHCQNSFTAPRWRNRAKYCSLECRDASKRKDRFEVDCVVCGKQLQRLAIHLHKSGRNVCGPECRGKLHRRVRPSGAGFARKWAVGRGLLKQCNRCSYSRHSEILVVHHIDRNRGNNTPSNLEILCPNCHAIEHYVCDMAGVA